MIKTYYLLTKPGIIAGNLITTSSAFILASKGQMDYLLFLWTVLGLFGVIASACVLNNYIDREADGKMERTKNRPLAVGSISTKKALGFAVILGILGFWVLWQYTNFWAVSAAFVGFVIYAGLYSFWKYRHATAVFVGSVAGAMPPVVGYCAANGYVDLGALIIFSLLILWQMPHFFAISMYRVKEYTGASIPVFPATKGAFATKLHILCYTIAFLLVSLLPTFYGLTGPLYLLAAIPLSVSWVLLSVKGFKAPNDQVWARQMFVCSLIVIMGLSFMLPFG
jgi:protoheme IX farnesyltransferase